MTSEKLGTLLVDQGIITPGDLSLALAVQGSLEERERIGHILCHYDLLSEEALVRALAEQSGWPVFDGEIKADPDMVSLLGKAFLQEHHALPVSADLFVLSDPYDTVVTDRILRTCREEVRFHLGRSTEIRTALAAVEEAVVSPKSRDLPEMLDAAGALLDEAVAMGASDIHIEPSEKAVEVRLRVDGVLRFYRSFPLKDNPRLVNIFFNKAEISAGDFLHSHDARFDHSSGARKVDVRLSHIPSMNGSSLVLRIGRSLRAR